MSWMRPLSSPTAHSAIVKIRLLVNGDSLAVAQMGPDCLFLCSPVDHQPGEAIIVMKVDDSVQRWKVWLPEGISSVSARVMIAALG